MQETFVLQFVLGLPKISLVCLDYRSDTNQAVQPQEMVRYQEFHIYKVEGLTSTIYMYVHVAKTKLLISCEVTTQLICTFVFALEIKVFSRPGSYYSSQFAK